MRYITPKRSKILLIRTKDDFLLTALKPVFERNPFVRVLIIAEETDNSISFYIPYLEASFIAFKKDFKQQVEVLGDFDINYN